MTYVTEQERFWAGEFGAGYRGRNQGQAIVSANVSLFGKILRSAPQVASIMELGCNIGLNLAALHSISPRFELAAVEINADAAREARDLGVATVLDGTITAEIAMNRTYDLVFTKGVLIHIAPEKLEAVYRNLHALSARYIMVCEYYSPTPQSVTYRGHENRLFKRDFAGELMDRYGLRLIDYGFQYHRDNYFPQDDGTWFLMEKVGVV